MLARGTAEAGRFESDIDPGFVLFSAWTSGASAELAEPFPYGVADGERHELTLPLVAAAYVHLVWLPKHGINGWTAEPRDRYLELMERRRAARGR